MNMFASQTSMFDMSVYSLRIDERCWMNRSKEV
jgi:hypothetical protein